MRRLFRRAGLQLQITASLLLLVSAALLATGFLSIRHSIQELKLEKQQDELVMARNIAAQTDEVLVKARQTVEALAVHPGIQSMDPAWQREAMTLVARVTELMDGFAVFNASGRLICMDETSPETKLLLPPAGTSSGWIREIGETRQSRFSPTFRSEAGEATVAINAPILHGKEFVGMLSGFILLKNHSLGGIEAIRIGESGYAYIVDESGRTIVHPQRERIFEDMRTHPAVQELRRGKDGVLEFINAEGTAVLAAFAKIPATGWGVVVRQPTSESYDRGRKMVRSLTGILILSLVVAGATGIWLGRRIARPVSALAAGVARISQGDFEARIPVSSEDEIGKLGSAFNEMSSRIRQQMDDMRLAQQRIVEAQDRVVRSEKMAAVGQLAAGLAHEINNPLNVVSGFTEMLLDKAPAATVERQRLEEIYRETTRCQRLVKELLDFAKPRPPELKRTDLNKLAGEAVSLIEASSRGQGIETEVRLLGAPLESMLDPDQVKQVLLNLLLNASQAMPSGGRITVDSGRTERGQWVRVSDSGPGIAEEHLSALFTPFFSTKEGGTGLGLPLSYAIMERHGGRIVVENLAGGGAAFTLEFPEMSPNV